MNAKLNIPNLTFLFICFILFLLFAWFTLAIIFDKPPQFFPLNNSGGRYTIVHSSKMAPGWEEYESSGEAYLSQPQYFVEYRGKGVFSDVKNKNFFRVVVGNSKIDLYPLIGKDVLITKGSFVDSTKQCIVESCIDINPHRTVLDIEEMVTVK